VFAVEAVRCLVVRKSQQIPLFSIFATPSASHPGHQLSSPHEHRWGPASLPRLILLPFERTCSRSSRSLGYRCFFIFFWFKGTPGGNKSTGERRRGLTKAQGRRWKAQGAERGSGPPASTSLIVGSDKVLVVDSVEAGLSGGLRACTTTVESLPSQSGDESHDESYHISDQAPFRLRY